jgi:hypothetical protein
MEEPTKAETTDYFRRFGLRLRNELKALADPEFAVFGTRTGPEGELVSAKQENWFIGYRAVVEAAMALKISNLLHLPENEKKLFLEAAMTHHATKRIQYARQDNVDSATYDDIQKSGAERLINSGIDPRAIEIGRGVGPNFKQEIASGQMQPRNKEEERLFKLQCYLAYVENCVEQTFDRTAHTQEADISDWKERINASRVRYPNIKPEEFDTEIAVTGEIERELAAAIRSKNPDLTVEEDIPLWTFLRKEIMRDIAKGELPL